VCWRGVRAEVTPLAGGWTVSLCATASASCDPRCRRCYSVPTASPPPPSDRTSPPRAEPWNRAAIIANRYYLEQAVNLRCVHVNSASYPSRDGKWVVAYELRGEGLVWLIGAVVCLYAAPRVQLFASAGNGWPHNVMCRGIISSCQSAATSEIVKRFWSRVHV